MAQAASSQRGSRARRKDSSYGCVVRSFSQTTAAVARMNSTMGVQCCKKAFTMLRLGLPIHQLYIYYLECRPLVDLGPPKPPPLDDIPSKIWAIFNSNRTPIASVRT